MNTREYVDLHCHFFNTRYLPIAGVMRHYAGLGRATAAFIAWAARRLAADDPTLDHDSRWGGPVSLAAGESAESAHALPGGHPPEQAIEWLVEKTPEDLIRCDAYDEVVAELQGQTPGFAAATTPPAESVDARKKFLGELLKGRADANLSGAAGGTASTVGGAIAFVRDLVQSEKQSADVFHERCAEVGLFVHHMMDMQHPFGSDPDYDYGRCVLRTRRLCQQSVTRAGGAGVVAFVAFDAHRPETVAVVEGAVLRKSFVGVKFYPACGYRPDRNAEAVQPRDRRTDARDLDARCAALFELCEGHDIPIMAHCSTGGMEVVPGSSGMNSNPANWERVLAARPNLRVCFGHAGGPSPWFPSGRDEDTSRIPDYPWLTKIIAFCKEYPNVYLDISHKEEFLNERQRLLFAGRFAESLEEEPRLRDKVIYGSDYPMRLPAGGWTGYYAGTRGLFELHPALKAHRVAVFRNNALAFLNLKRFVERRGGDLTPQQRAFLGQYLA